MPCLRAPKGVAARLYRLAVVAGGELGFSLDGPFGVVRQFSRALLSNIGRSPCSLGRFCANALAFQIAYSAQFG